MDHGDVGAAGKHRADIGVRGIAATRSGAFEQAALALTAVVCDPASVEPREAVPIGCDAADDEGLLVAWLNALVYEMAVRHMLFGRFSAADAFYTPVCSRISTYALPVSEASAAYVARVLALPAVRAWSEAALQERDFLDFDEPYRSAR